jgi:mRNA interferase MazF
VVIRRGDVWWVLHPSPDGASSERRPGVVVQSDELNRTEMPTVLVVPCTSSLVWEDQPGCVRLGKEDSGLPRDAVAQAFATSPMARGALADRAGRLSPAALESLLHAVDDALGR